MALARTPGDSAAGSPVDWESLENSCFINPAFSRVQAEPLLQRVHEVSSKFQGHVFILTSGTTSQSLDDLKWVALSKAAFLVAANAVNEHLSSDRSDIWLHSLPEFHVGGLGIWARSALSGAHVVRANSKSWKAVEFSAAIESSRATLASLVPTQIFDLVKDRIQCPSSVRAVLVGGAALSRSLYRAARELGWPLLPSYGMTETCALIAAATLDGVHKKQSSEDDFPVLKILPHIQVEQASEGRLRFHGTSLLTAYLCKKNVGDEVIVQDPKEGGWFLSQDQGEVENGILRIFGRMNDFIKVGGEMVAMNRLRGLLEEALTQLNLQTDVVLIPVSNERLGHTVQLVCDQKLSDENVSVLIERFNSKVLGFEKIRTWHRMDVIPRNSLGKLVLSECLQAIEKKSLCNS